VDLAGLAGPPHRRRRHRQFCPPVAVVLLVLVAAAVPRRFCRPKKEKNMLTDRAHLLEVLSFYSIFAISTSIFSQPRIYLAVGPEF